MNEFLERLQELGGFWQWKPGNKYIAQLTSGKVSDVYCNCSVLTSRPAALCEVSKVLWGRLLDFFSQGEQICLVEPLANPVYMFKTLLEGGSE